MDISRRREANFRAENGPETVENDQTGLPSWAAALTAQMQTAFAEQLAAQDTAHGLPGGTTGTGRGVPSERA